MLSSIFTKKLAIKFMQSLLLQIGIMVVMEGAQRIRKRPKKKKRLK